MSAALGGVTGLWTVRRDRAVSLSQRGLGGTGVVLRCRWAALACRTGVMFFFFFFTVGRLVGRSVVRSVGWFVGCLVGRSVGRLVVRSVGRSIILCGASVWVLRLWLARQPIFSSWA